MANTENPDSATTNTGDGDGDTTNTPRDGPRASAGNLLTPGLDDVDVSGGTSSHQVPAGRLSSHSADEDILVYNPASSAAVWVRSTGARGKAWNRILHQLRKVGVPNTIRGNLWLACSGALWELRNNPGYYKRLTDQIEERSAAKKSASSALHKAKSCPDVYAPRDSLAAEDKQWENWVQEINADVERTFRKTEKREPLSEDMRSALNRVLLSYAMHDTAVGYCQAFVHIAAGLLEWLEEEQTFWVLVCILKRLLPRDYHTTMLGSLVDQHVLADLVDAELPELSAHLQKLGGTGREFAMITAQWLPTLFSESFPAHLLTILWDLLFAYGTCMLFKIALAIVRAQAPYVLQATSYGAAMVALQDPKVPGIHAADRGGDAGTPTKQFGTPGTMYQDFSSQERVQIVHAILFEAVQSKTINRIRAINRAVLQEDFSRSPEDGAWGTDGPASPAGEPNLFDAFLMEFGDDPVVPEVSHQYSPSFSETQAPFGYTIAGHDEGDLRGSSSSVTSPADGPPPAMVPLAKSGPTYFGARLKESKGKRAVNIGRRNTSGALLQSAKLLMRDDLGILSGSVDDDLDWLGIRSSSSTPVEKRSSTKGKIEDMLKVCTHISY
jgi:hypothetical protein